MWNRMVANPRSELASGITEGHCNGLRASYPSANLERSASFRESIDSRALFSVGSNRITSQVSPAEIPPPAQTLILDFISLGDQKYPRAGELRRAVGISLEDHSFSAIQSKNLTPAATEELKRFKSSIVEANSKARDRTRLLQESISKLDCYRGMISKKRQRSETSSSEKSGSGNIMKMGSQLPQSPADLASQKLEERTKSLVPNKRMRTSMAEVRADGRGIIPQNKEKIAPIDKEKSMLRACNGLMPVEDKLRVLPGGEGWDKKMKRKRSMCPGIMRPMDGDREIKSSLQQRSAIEPRVRPSDGIIQRQVSSGGVTGSLKSDNSPQSTGAGNRPISRAEFDSAFLMNDRKERCSVPKGGNKSNVRENSQMGSQSSLIKGKASRGPRTGSCAIMSSSSGFQRSSGGIDGWDQTLCPSKVPSLGGSNTRKNSLPSVPTSPPMAQWGSQRLPKNTRTRRPNLLPPTLNQEPPMLTEGVSSEVIRSYQKPKLDGVLSPPTASESEESPAAEFKYSDRVLHSSDLEDGDVSALQKATSLLLHSKKNKPPRDEMGSGVRKPGRSGNRGSINQKAGAQLTKEKLETADASRSMRIGRPGSDSSKGGRPPSKKASERKSYGRPPLALNNGSAEISGDQDDDLNELLSAADYARDISGQRCSSSFWKSTEELFSFTSEEPLSYLKQQINFLEEVDEGTNEEEAFSEKQQWLESDFPLSQRLLSAFIEDDDMCQASADPESEHDVELTFHGRSSCDGYGNHGDELLQEMDVSCSTLKSQHSQRCLNEKITMELQSVGLLDDPGPGLVDGEENDINKMIATLRGELYDKMKTKKARLLQLDQAIQNSREEDEKRLEKAAMDKLVEMAYKKCLGGRGGQKGGVNRISKQAALSFAKRVLERCRSYDTTGVSCFRELLFLKSKPVDCSQRPETGPTSESDHPIRAKKRELLLDDVVGVSPSCITGGRNSFSGAAKGKRSEMRNPKSGRPSGPRGERKTKMMPKQKTVLLSPPHSANPENSSREIDAAVGFPNLLLESMDGLDVQGQDIGSWLSVDDDGFLDNDPMMGLEIPMDDLSEINMNF